mmetsp:Transcript_46705/g.120413  ORF Transcript_46705/g.120413 Transcript_46705/m.120413 type:complete len:113 (-) Transcript_46705:49-387(-)
MELSSLFSTASATATMQNWTKKSSSFPLQPFQPSNTVETTNSMKQPTCKSILCCFLKVRARGKEIGVGTYQLLAVHLASSFSGKLKSEKLHHTGEDCAMLSSPQAWSGSAEC